MSLLFDSKVSTRPNAYMGASSLEIEREPMLFQSGLGFSFANGGKLTKAFLAAVIEAHPEAANHIILDSRVHMLMRGWYPCIPGWHHDDVRREEGERGQPDYSERGMLVKPVQHAQLVIDSNSEPTESLPEFMSGKVEVPYPVPGNVYGAWDAHLTTMGKTENLKVEPVRSGVIYYFDSHTFHRGTPAKRMGWRFFVRASWLTPRQPVNKIRLNANVYLPAVSEGW